MDSLSCRPRCALASGGPECILRAAESRWPLCAAASRSTLVTAFHVREWIATRCFPSGGQAALCAAVRIYWDAPLLRFPKAGGESMARPVVHFEIGCFPDHSSEIGAALSRSKAVYCNLGFRQI